MNTFRIEYALNSGGFLSLGGSLSEQTRYIIFIVMNSILICGAAIYLLLNPLLTARYYWSIGLIVAGGIGNLIDRIRFDGKVIDFMILQYGSLHTGIFNVADVAITTGVIAIFLFQLFEDNTKQEKIVSQPPE
jgi:signal peptidase II